MLSCPDMDRLLTPYLDEEATVEDRQAVSAHLTACPGCARRAAAEAAARRVLMARSSALAPRAPAALRQRCQALSGRRQGLPPATTEWRLLGLLAASLVVVALAGVLAVGVATHSTSLLVAELALDHLKCFALFEPRAVSADPGEVARQLKDEYGWSLSIPGSRSDQRLVLLGARRCYSTDGRLAHVLYRHGGRPLSLFMIPSESRAEARVAMGGRAARVWSQGTTTYVLLGDESEGEMQPVAAYFQSARF